MDSDSSKLFEALRGAGLSSDAIEAAWPSWWSDEIAVSPSGRAELRFSLARKLGLAPKPLLGERVEFVWKDKARFKHLTSQDAVQQSILSSFGVAVGRLLLRAIPPGASLHGVAAHRLRETILQEEAYVDLRQLITICWAVGIPVVQLQVFPLATKSMHAMVIEAGGRHAILLARESIYPAPAAFTLAHEIGHIALGHIEGAAALVDTEDPATAPEHDTQELEANAFALELLTGSPEPEIQTELQNFNAPTLANAVLNAGPQYRIEPGTLALCVAYRRKLWPVAMSALRFIYTDPKPVSREINRIAASQIDWTSLTQDGEEFLRNLMTLNDG